MSACSVIFPLVTGPREIKRPSASQSDWRLHLDLRGDPSAASFASGAKTRIEVGTHRLNNPDALIVEHQPHRLLLIWGDPSQKRWDHDIRLDAAKSVAASHWGRSWLCIDWAHHTLTGATDRLGLFPILLQRRGDTCYVASDRLSLSQILPAAPALDPYSVLEMLGLGQVLEESSIFANTRHLGAGMGFHLSAFGELTETVTEPVRLQKTGNCSLGEATEILGEAVARCYQSQSIQAVSLSGGLDSRVLLAASLAGGFKPVGLSYGVEASSDLRIARDLAEMSQIGLFEGPLDHVDRWKAFQRIARQGGGEVAIHHGHALMNEDLLQATRGMTLITGTGAETFRAFYYDRGMPGFSLFGLNSLRDRFMPMAKRYIREEFGKLLDPFMAAFPEAGQVLEERLGRVIARYENPEQDSARFLDNVYLGERVRRMVVSGQQLLDQHYDRCHPFLDPEVIQALTNLPVHYRIGSRFHHHAIEQLRPQLMTVTWDKTQQPLSKGLSFAQRYPGLAARMGISPVWGKQSTGMAPYQNWLDVTPGTGLANLLSATGLSSREIQQGFEALLSSRAGLHCRGVALALQFWIHAEKTRTLEVAL